MLSWVFDLVLYISLISTAYANVLYKAVDSGCGDVANSKQLSLKEQKSSIYTLIINELSKDCVELKLIDSRYNFTYQNIIYPNDYNLYHTKSSLTSSNTIHSRYQLRDIIVAAIESGKTYNIDKNNKSDYNHDIILHITLNTKIANYDLNVPLTFIEPPISKLLSLIYTTTLQIDRLNESLQSLQNKHNKLQNQNNDKLNQTIHSIKKQIKALQNNKLNGIVQKLQGDNDQLNKRVQMLENKACPSSVIETMDNEISTDSQTQSVMTTLCTLFKYGINILYILCLVFVVCICLEKSEKAKSDGCVLVILFHLVYVLIYALLAIIEYFT
eukprot:443818_1